MANYPDEAAAAADGLTIEHESERGRFAVYAERESGRALIGEAHYSLREPGAIDFDHTYVVPPFRGTGISEVLARHALTSQVARAHRITASCWFIAEFLEKYPDLAE